MIAESASQPEIEKTQWHGTDAWQMQSETLRVTVVPEMGAKIVSLFDRRHQVEWLAPPAEPFKPLPYGAIFDEHELGGWDEMFPTIVACSYPVEGEYYGADLPDHGEIWTVPWDLVRAGEGELTFQVEGRALPYRLTRSIRFGGPNSLVLNYSAENLTGEEMPYMWSAHPMLACGDMAELRLPPEVAEVYTVAAESQGWGPPETLLVWPDAKRQDGQQVRIDRTGPPSLHQARKIFTRPEDKVSWFSLMRKPSEDWITFKWDPKAVPYFGLWVDQGYLNSNTIVTPEPITGFYDSLVIAWEKGMVKTLSPGKMHQWSLEVRVGQGEPTIPVSKHIK